jgi:hypothetical protein
MENKVDKINFKNSVEVILEEFLSNQYNVDDPIYDIYVVFDYKDVQKCNQEIDKDNLTNKPIIHIVENNISNDKETYGDGELKVQTNYFNYSIFSVINENYLPNKKRKILLNEISSKIKYKFDNYKNYLDEFKNVDINYSNGILSKKSDNLYASQQILKFIIYKEF